MSRYAPSPVDANPETAPNDPVNKGDSDLAAPSPTPLDDMPVPPLTEPADTNGG